MTTISTCLMPLLVFALLLALPQVDALQRNGNADNKLNVSFEDFIITTILPDGETQRIIKWQKICAKETIVNWGDTSIALREVALEESGKKLQLIYEGDSLNDCVQEQSIETNYDICGLTKDSNIDDESNKKFNVLENLNDPSTSSMISWLVSSQDLLRRCHQARTRVKNQILKEHFKQRRFQRGIEEIFIAPGTKWCGPSRIASSYKDIGGLDKVDRCCRRHDHCGRAISPFSKRYNFWNNMPFTLSHCGCDQSSRQYEIATGMRSKGAGKRRGRNRRELFLMPGTQWCGRGNRATKYTNLGSFGKADACCRRHDTACPFYISAFETRYGLFNWGISTLMHCTCDERFRTCLKMAGTSSANLIGKIFFNVVQTKCFVLKPHKVCVKSTWWGKCERHEYKKQAHLRNNISY